MCTFQSIITLCLCSLIATLLYNMCVQVFVICSLLDLICIACSVHAHPTVSALNSMVKSFQALRNCNLSINIQSSAFSL